MISFEFLKFSIGDTLLAFLADDILDRYIVTIPNSTATIIGNIDISSTIAPVCANKYSPITALTILTSTKHANIPDNIPNGIPTVPNISPSNITFFLICFLVAPMLDSIPYIFIFSAVAIANEFLIQNTLVNTIITKTTDTTVYIIDIVELLNLKTSHFKSSSFISNSSYLVSPFACAKSSIFDTPNISDIDFSYCLGSFNAMYAILSPSFLFVVIAV